MPPHAPPGPLVYLLPILIILPILYFRLRRTMRPQVLKLNQIWIRPAIYLVIAGMVGVGAAAGRRTPDAAGRHLVCAGGALLGVVGGWQMGRVTAIHVDTEKGTLMATGGQAAMIVILVLILVRMAVGTGLRMEASAWHLNVAVITDASIVFAGCLFAARGAGNVPARPAGDA